MNWNPKSRVASSHMVQPESAPLSVRNLHQASPPDKTQGVKWINSCQRPSSRLKLSFHIRTRRYAEVPLRRLLWVWCPTSSRSARTKADKTPDKTRRAGTPWARPRRRQSPQREALGCWGGREGGGKAPFLRALRMSEKARREVIFFNFPVRGTRSFRVARLQRGARGASLLPTAPLRPSLSCSFRGLGWARSLRLPPAGAPQPV